MLGRCRITAAAPQAVASVHGREHAKRHVPAGGAKKCDLAADYCPFGESSGLAQADPPRPIRQVHATARRVQRRIREALAADRDLHHGVRLHGVRLELAGARHGGYTPAKLFAGHLFDPTDGGRGEGGGNDGRAGVTC